MRVFFFIASIPPDYGGGFLRTFRIAARFKQYGWLWRVATFTKRTSYKTNVQGISKDDILFCQDQLLTSLFSLPWLLLRHALDYQVFYVASTHWFTVVPSFIARLLGKKVVHGVTLSMVDSPAVRAENMLKRPYFWLKNFQFRFADYIFVNSPLLLKECTSCGYGDDVVKLINNPVDTARFYPIVETEKRKLKIENNLPVDTFTILFVGSINRRKGCDLFPLIFRELFTRINKPLTFIMCGQMGYPETEGILKELADIFSEYRSSLIVKEEVDNPTPYYQMADLFLFPTTNEGMPNVILEAMASGCMILCNRLDGITDYALGAECLINGNDVIEYVNRIIDYQSNPKIYDNIIAYNRKKICNEFSVDYVDGTIKHLFDT